MICYYAPPTIGSAGVRLGHYLRSFSDVANEVVLITTSNRAIFPKNKTDIEKFNIIESRTLDFRTLYYMFRKRPPLMVGEDMANYSKLMEVLINRRLFSEGGTAYIRRAVKIGAKEIKNKNINVIFSSYRPFADHIIAKKLKDRYPELYWIADFRDVNGQTNDSLTSDNKLPEWQRKIIDSADELVTVSKGLQKYLSQYHNNVTVLRNGSSVKNDSNGISKNAKFTFNYTGSIYSMQRIHPLLYCIKKLIDEGQIDQTKIQFTYAGKDGGKMERIFSEYGLQYILENRGLVEIHKAHEMQARADVNVLLTWTNHLTGILTGKLYEYIATLRPILALVNGETDEEIEEIINEVGGEVIYNDNYTQLSTYILDKITNMNCVTNGSTAQAVKKYTWKHQFDSWFSNTE